jgi:hypothetical protein
LQRINNLPYQFGGCLPPPLISFCGLWVAKKRHEKKLLGGPCHGSYLGHESSQNTRQSLSPLKLMPLEVSSWGGGIMLMFMFC